jgi:hypothetical protein
MKYQIVAYGRKYLLCHKAIGGHLVTVAECKSREGAVKIIEDMDLRISLPDEKRAA